MDESSRWVDTGDDDGLEWDNFTVGLWKDLDSKALKRRTKAKPTTVTATTTTTSREAIQIAAGDDRKILR
jgi:hypothetical protein